MHETIPRNEAADIQAVAELSVALMDRARRPVRRGQHPKHHGCVRGKFIVEPFLPPELARGVFAVPGAFLACVRFSNGSQDDDRKGDVHGMAIKLVDVGGEKLLEDERQEKTQDFVLMDHPAFFARDARSNHGLAKAILLSRGPSWLKSLLFWMPEERRRGAYIVLRHFIFGFRFHELRMLRAATSKTPDDPLDLTYWSATPYQLGDLAVKFKAVPSAAMPAPPNAELPAAEADSPNRLRAALRQRLRAQEVTFDLMVQVYQDDQRTPIEDASIVWEDGAAPFRKLASLVIPPQSFDSPEQMRFCENLSFTPWHSLPEHRPLGGVNRARRQTYLASSRLRHELNEAPRREPQPSDIAQNFPCPQDVVSAPE